jgi:hypothetical protein
VSESEGVWARLGEGSGLETGLVMGVSMAMSVPSPDEIHGTATTCTTTASDGHGHDDLTPSTSRAQACCKRQREQRRVRPARVR